jgi:hypothetical protein
VHGGNFGCWGCGAWYGGLVVTAACDAKLYCGGVGGGSTSGGSLPRSERFANRDEISWSGPRYESCPDLANPRTLRLTPVIPLAVTCVANTLDQRGTSAVQFTRSLDRLPLRRKHVACSLRIGTTYCVVAFVTPFYEDLFGHTGSFALGNR